jgi:hypothetical protein
MGKSGSRGKNRKQVSTAELQNEIRLVNAHVGPLGLKVRDVPGDGNCLFRAAADQLYETSAKHANVRRDTVQYIEDHPDAFAPFVEDDESFGDYVSRMREDAEWGGHLEIQAMSLLYGTDIIIHMPEGPRMEVRNPGTTGVWHICYLSGEHYGSVRCVDPDQKEAMVQRWKAHAALPTVATEKGNKKASSALSYDVPESMVELVTDVIPRPLQTDYIRQLIREHDYDVEAVVDALQRTHLRSSSPSGDKSDASSSGDDQSASRRGVKKKTAKKEAARVERHKRVKTAGHPRRPKPDPSLPPSAPTPTALPGPGLRI